MIRWIVLLTLICFPCHKALAVTDVVKTFEYSGGDYGKLSDCVAYFQANYPNFVTSDINGICRSSSSWSASDTTAVTISGLTTDATHTFKVETTGDARHQGVWSTSAYRLSNTTTSTITNSVRGVTIDGLQAYMAYPGGTDYRSVIEGYATSGAGNVYIKNCIFWAGNNVGASVGMSGLYDIIVFNNIIYSSSSTRNGLEFGAIDFNTNALFYNNTVSGFGNGIVAGGGNHMTSKNNISYNNTTGYSGTFNSNSTHNLSKDATAPEYGTYYRNKTITFVNTTAGSEDFHLVSSDTDAIDKGADLSGTFTTDIDGTTRSGTWDIGADEYVSAVTPSLPFVADGNFVIMSGSDFITFN